MAQNDYVIADQSGLSFLSDLNSVLAALVSQNSGATQPSTTYAYQPWADTTTGLMKVRNASNTAFIPLFRLDGAFLLVPPADGSVTTPRLDDGAVTAAKAAIATQSQAEGGNDTTTLMTPQRTAQAISALAFPSGTAMLFAQTSAPTGWTKSVTHNDKALRVVSGTAGSGGAASFSSVMNGSVGATTLTESQIPSHSHTYSGASSAVTGNIRSSITSATSPAVTPSTNATGGGGSHTHSMNVAYVDVIIATKD